MTPDIRWLARLCIDRDLATKEQCRNVLMSLGENAEIGDFAQKLIDEGVVNDVEALENIAGMAIAQSREGSPTRDPFNASRAPFPAGANQRAHAAGTEAQPRAGNASPTTFKGEPHEFPFGTLGMLDDAALATAMKDLLLSVSRSGASDLHLSTGRRPFIRRNREILFIGDVPLAAFDALRLNTALLGEAEKKVFFDRRDYDYALALSGADRYRVNLMFHKDGPAGSYRMVPDRVRSLEELGFGPHRTILEKLLSYHNGLILITGPVGSGKTTTLASIVAHLDSERTDHIITVEDPIEVVHRATGCNITQREVGPHTMSFATALKGALREDPDVIVIGELRDLETIEMAITASETGHLVIGTMHTSDAATTLNRVLDVFPPAQQTQIRASVAESLRGVVCQRLLPATDGSLALACEVMVNNTAIQNLIREGKTQGLRNTMETGTKEGMCLMGNAVFALWEQGRITADMARANIANRTQRAKVTG